MTKSLRHETAQYGNKKEHSMTNDTTHRQKPNITLTPTLMWQLQDIQHCLTTTKRRNLISRVHQQLEDKSIENSCMQHLQCHEKQKHNDLTHETQQEKTQPR